MKKRGKDSGLRALQGGATPIAPGSALLTGGTAPVSMENALMMRKVQELMAEEMKSAMQEILRREAEVEYKFSLQDSWSVQLFTAVAKKYGITPYRAHGQKAQTVMIRASKTVVDEQLWPEFNRLCDRLHHALHTATDDLIAETLGADYKNWKH